MSRSALLAHDRVRTLGNRRVLDGVSLTAAPGQRIGLIGENGTGNSTLLRLLAGADEPHAGTVVCPPELGFLHQEMPFDPASTIAAMLDDALRDAREDLAELDRLSGALTDTPRDAPEYVDLLAADGDRLDRAQTSDAWDADRRTEMMLAGLGLRALPRERRLASLSGATRASLVGRPPGTAAHGAAARRAHQPPRRRCGLPRGAFAWLAWGRGANEP
ncbi:ATP-binding cassette domain-containing protein [Micromonospora zamorensis]|uniref:ATP-binding cassette domain-containing protein n=1 Tax=Micromonospora zamorensis TaxID=709883 RepID=UPI003CEEA935